MLKTKDLNGIQGVLALVGLGLIASPLFILIQTIIQIYNIQTELGLINLLMGAGTLYNISLILLFIFGIIFNLFQIVVFIYLISLFYKCDYRLPKIYINVIFIVTFISLVFNILNYIFTSTDLIKLMSNSIRSIIFCFFWVLYFLKSERVRNTFVKNKKISINENAQDEN